MNKKSNFLVALMIFFFAFTTGLGTDIEELLRVSDVEQVTGIKGIQLIPRDPLIGAGGDLNFARADKDMVLMVLVKDSSMYEEWKNIEGYFHASVPDIGDEAFEGPSFGEFRYILIFRKGNKAVSISAFMNLEAGGEPFLNMEQLCQIAEIIISRL